MQSWNWISYPGWNWRIGFFFFRVSSSHTSQVFVILNASFVVVTIWFVVQFGCFQKKKELSFWRRLVGEVEIIENWSCIGNKRSQHSNVRRLLFLGFKGWRFDLSFLPLCGSDDKIKRSLKVVEEFSVLQDHWKFVEKFFRVFKHQLKVLEEVKVFQDMADLGFRVFKLRGCRSLRVSD